MYVICVHSLYSLTWQPSTTNYIKFRESFEIFTTCNVFFFSYLKKTKVFVKQKSTILREQNILQYFIIISPALLSMCYPPTIPTHLLNYVYVPKGLFKVHFKDCLRLGEIQRLTKVMQGFFWCYLETTQGPFSGFTYGVIIGVIQGTPKVLFRDYLEGYIRGCFVPILGAILGLIRGLLKSSLLMNLLNQGVPMGYLRVTYKITHGLSQGDIFKSHMILFKLRDN